MPVSTASDICPNLLNGQDIATYRRDGVVCLRQVFDADWLARLTRATERTLAKPGPLGMDLHFSPDDLAFRDEVRTFLADKLPATLRERVQKFPSYVDRDDLVIWHKILHDKGWIAPSWPTEYGGTGWTPTQKFIYEEEYQAADAPRISPFGIMSASAFVIVEPV